MSYEKTTAIRIDKKNDTFEIKADSNNVFPKNYHWYSVKIPLRAMPNLICGGLIQFIVHSDKHIHIVNLCRAVENKLQEAFGLGAYEFGDIAERDVSKTEEFLLELKKRLQDFTEKGQTNQYYLDRLKEISIKIAVLESPEKLALLDSIIEEFVRLVKLPTPRTSKVVIALKGFDSYVYKYSSRSIKRVAEIDNAKRFSKIKADWLLSQWEHNFSNKYVAIPI